MVTFPREAPKTLTRLKNGSGDFEKLTWLDFTSNATDKATFYLDHIGITNQP